MFLEKTSEDDFFSSLENKLIKQHSFNSDVSSARSDKLVSYLGLAAQSLINVGLKKEAQMVLKLKSVCTDPATKNLSSEQMLHNLANKGWVFNADDHDVDTCEADDCAMCSEGDEPQLSQKELVSVRKLLSKD